MPHHSAELQPIPAFSAESSLVQQREYRLIKWGTIVVLALGCALPLSFNLVDPDLWGHVKYAEDWLQTGSLPRTASHTYTADGQPWINHENLAELAFALGFRHLGVPGMLIAKCLGGMAILLAMVWIARKQQVDLLVVWAFLLLVATNLQPFFPMRPQLLSFGLCAGMLVLVERGFRDWHPKRQLDWRWLTPLPFLFAIWVNSHGGFVLGLCVLGAYLGGRILELVSRRQSRSLGTAFSLALLGIACIVATLANPYGIELHRWLITSLGSPRPEITEWVAPKPSDPLFWSWITLMAVAAAALAASKRPRDWVQVTILILVAWQSMLHLRHIAFLALLCGFWIPPHLHSALGRLRPTGQLGSVTLAPWFRRIVVTGLLATIGVQAFALDERLTTFPVERNRYPVDALQFMSEYQLDGKLVVSFNWAQYAIAALAPEVEVAFDGRFRTCYPQEVVDMHFDFLLGEFGGNRSRSSKSGPIDGRRVLEYGQPDLVLVDRRYVEPVATMQELAQAADPEWVLLFRDRIAEVWGRSSRFDNPSHPDYIPPRARLSDPRPRDGFVQWPALPLKIHSEQVAGTAQTDRPIDL